MRQNAEASSDNFDGAKLYFSALSHKSCVHEQLLFSLQCKGSLGHQNIVEAAAVLQAAISALFWESETNVGRRSVDSLDLTNLCSSNDPKASPTISRLVV